jgi:hypothetical protein
MVETNDSPLIHKLILALSQNKPNQKLDNNKLHRSLDLKSIEFYFWCSVFLQKNAASNNIRNGKIIIVG